MNDLPRLLRLPCRQRETESLRPIIKRAKRFRLPRGGFHEMTRLRHEKLVPLEALGRRERLDDGRGWIVRLYNVSGADLRVSMTWAAPAPAAFLMSDTSERAGAPIQGAIPIPAWGVATVRAER